MIVVWLGLGGALWGGAAIGRSYEASAAREIASRLSDLPDAKKRVSVKATGGLPLLWGEAGTVTIVASGFSTPRLPFETEPWRSKYGKLNRLKFDFREFAMGGLKVESFRADLRDNRFDLGLAGSKRVFRLSRSGSGPGEVVIRGEDLAAFARQKYPLLKTLTLWLEDDRFRAEGSVVIFQETAFTAEGRLFVEDGRRLRAAEVTLSVAGTPRPELVPSFLKNFDPLVDLDGDLGLKGALFVREIWLRNGRLIAKGRATIPEAPPEARPAGRSPSDTLPSAPPRG